MEAARSNAKNEAKTVRIAEGSRGDSATIVDTLVEEEEKEEEEEGEGEG